MRIQFFKLSDEEHQVTITRSDGSTETKHLNSRSFLFHDLAHFVLESEIPLKEGFWGCVAEGANLDSSNCSGTDILLAEQIAGPFQVLVKNDAPVSSYQSVLSTSLPYLDQTNHLAESIHSRVRQIKGLWRATNYGKQMELTWPY